MKIALVQINNSFSGQNYLPYSAGILQAYAEKHLTDPTAFEFMVPLYTRIPVEEALERIEGAAAVFFSVYVWNIRISLEIARRYKKAHPDAVIVFGGPQVPDRVEEFFRANRFIDVCCHGEGERAFVAILEHLSSRNWSEVGSISFFDERGTLVTTPRMERIQNLSVIPSPYLAGTFEPLMKAFPNEKWIVLWETNRGCPFSCTFCDWGSATQVKIFTFDMERLKRELEWFAENRIEFIFCADANFGILARDIEIVTCAAETKARFGYPQALSVQNTKNVTDRAYHVQKTLAEAGLNKGVTISMQSLDPETLKRIKRDNISTRSFQELQRRFTRDRIETYTDMILGLPGETYDTFVSGVSDVIENGQHNRIQFNNLSLLPNAEMAAPEYRQRYGLASVESKVINIHGSLIESPDEIFETQELVVATDSMPPADWRRTRAFGWWAALLHFDKLLQAPLILARHTSDLSYRTLLEIFTEGDLSGFPVFSEIKKFFMEKAEDIQNGGPEYCRSEEYLNIWWPADELMFIRLVSEETIGEFYAEAEALLRRGLAGYGKSNRDAEALHESFVLNRVLIKLPFQTSDLELELGRDIWSFYEGVLRGENVTLAKHATRYRVDRTSMTWNSWPEWCREVVWYGNKKGAYLYRPAVEKNAR